MSNTNRALLLTCILLLALPGTYASAQTKATQNPQCAKDRALITKQTRRYKRACALGKTSKTRAEHQTLARQCDAYLSYLISKRDKKNFTIAKAQLKAIYQRGCDQHKDTLACGIFVSRGSRTTPIKTIKQNKRFKQFETQANTACKAGDALYCGAMLYMFGHKRGFWNPVARASYKAMIIKHAETTCAKQKSDDACLPVLMAGTYTNKWTPLKNLCDKKKIGPACRLYGDGIKRASQQWYQKGCAIGDTTSCTKYAQTLMKQSPQKGRALLRKTCARHLGACVSLEQWLKTQCPNKNVQKSTKP